MSLPIEAQVNAHERAIALIMARLNSIITAGGKVVIVSGGVAGLTPVTDAQYLVLAASSGLSAERIWTPGSGLQGTDGGAGLAYTAALGPLTALWSQTGVFDIEHAGNLRVAKYGRVGSISAPGNTSNGSLTVTKLFVNNDANYNLQVIGGNPFQSFDSGDAFVYIRTSNEFQYQIASAAVAGVNAALLYHTTGLVIGSGVLNANATADFQSTTLGILVPRVPTASLPTGVNGLLLYDSTTNRWKVYENGAYTNVVTEQSAAVDVSTVSTVSTTDATQTTLATIAVPATTTMLIEARVVARRTGGVLGTAEDGAGYDLEATVKNVAGTATLIGAVVGLSTQEDQVLWDATIDVNGGNARVRVTGAAQNNVDWKAAVKTLSVS